MIYIIIIGDRWYLCLSQTEASKFKRYWKGEMKQEASERSKLQGIVYIPELKLLVETFKLKWI